MRRTVRKKIAINSVLKWKIIFPLLILLLNRVEPLEGAKASLVSAPTSDGDTVLVTIHNLASPIPINDNILGGFVSEYERGGYIWDSDLALDDSLRNYGIRSIRLFGCGSEIYHWRDMVGPVETRKAWKHPSSTVCFGNDVRRIFGVLDNMDLSWGPDEFLHFFISRGIEVILTVNFSTGSAQEAANFVEYVNGISPDPDCDGTDGDMPNGWTPDSFAGDEAAPDGYFACLRHYFGHEEPYGVKYWEIGNEIFKSGGTGASWTKNVQLMGEQLYYNGGTNIISPGFTTRDPDRYDWSAERRQTTGAPNERFYVMFPPKRTASPGQYC